MLVFFSRLGLSTMSKVENTLTNLQIKLNQMILPNKIIWKTMTVCSGMTNGNQFFLILLNFFKSLFKKRTRVNQSLNSQIKETLTWLSVSQPFSGLRAPSNKINLKVVKFWRIILNHKMLITLIFGEHLRPLSSSSSSVELSNYLHPISKCSEVMSQPLIQSSSEGYLRS